MRYTLSKDESMAIIEKGLYAEFREVIKEEAKRYKTPILSTKVSIDDGELRITWEVKEKEDE